MHPAEAVPPTISKYELARVIGLRAQMLQQGAPPLVVSRACDPVEVAREEVAKEALPFSLRRRWQCGQEFYNAPCASVPERYAPSAAPPPSGAPSWRQ